MPSSFAAASCGGVAARSPRVSFDSFGVVASVRASGGAAFGGVASSGFGTSPRASATMRSMSAKTLTILSRTPMSR
ncbi:MAG: hypothetical protein LC800_20775 [Acidobacteria bacterium]|nr:hypothetical protein [Acidobacteriota bacterium]